MANKPNKEGLPKPMWQPNVLPNTSTPTLPSKGTQLKDKQLTIKRTGIFPK